MMVASEVFVLRKMCYPISSDISYLCKFLVNCRIKKKAIWCILRKYLLFLFSRFDSKILTAIYVLIRLCAYLNVLNKYIKYTVGP